MAEGDAIAKEATLEAQKLEEAEVFRLRSKSSPEFACCIVRRFFFFCFEEPKEYRRIVAAGLS